MTIPVNGGHAELVARSDVNPGRLGHDARLVARAGAPVPRRFQPDALARTIAREHIDRVVVTTPDDTHARYIEAALEGGADVVTEKPLTTTEDGHSLVVDHANGASMAHTLSAHGAWEGYTVAVNSTLGRAQLTVVERGAVLRGQGDRVLFDPMAHPEASVTGQAVRIADLDLAPFKPLGAEL